ncbi:cyclic nucleotide-binding domain-containing protein [Phthorimaea operculella]|nr:cyclic nucleotide-binding domain-containing protein [Phthorimaea operculella]
MGEDNEHDKSEGAKEQRQSRRLSSLDLYQFRRQSDRENLFVEYQGVPPIASYTNASIPNIIYEIDENKKQKTYAILQESRSEFHHNKLRYFLLIYSNTAWKLFGTVIHFIAYILETCLYTFFENKERPLWLIVIVIFLTLIFTCDVITLVGLKLSKKWRKTLNLVEPDTCKVIFDVILAVPYSFLYLIQLEDRYDFDFYAIAPLAALIRSYRIIEYFYNKSKEAGSNQWTTFLGQYLILFILSVHTWTCIWYLFAYKNFELNKIRDSWAVSAVYLPTETTYDWYFICWYWSMMFLTTNALGDLYPVTTTERIMGALAVLLGFLLTTIVFVGSLTSLFITVTTRRSKYVRQLTKIQNHLRLIHMDSETTRRIIRYYEDLWYQKSGVFQPKLMTLLPSPLQMEIAFDLNAVPLYSSLIFRQLPEAFLRRLSLAMTHRFYLPGDIVYEHNQNKTIMVCITNGVVELLSDQDDESPMISFTKGTCFGEISLVYNIPARCTVKAATYVECQVLDKTKFIKLMITYPDLVDRIREEIQKRIDRSHKSKSANDEPLTLNIYVSKDKRRSSIKCLKDKLRFIQGKTDEDTVTSDDELDKNCLDLYIISDHIKKKNKQFTCLTGKFPWILESECYLVKYWEIYMLALVSYICLSYPYFIGIKRSFPGGFFFFIQIGITLSLVTNMVITTVTAVKTKKRYLKDFWSILNYRMNTLGFYLDVIAIIPFEHIVTIHSASLYRDTFRDHLFYMCKGVKLCLVWRLSSFFDAMERKLLLNTILVKVSKYCVYICLLCYWCGIVLYMEACFVQRCAEDSWFSKAMTWDEKTTKYSANKVSYPLLTSVYFAGSLLLSVGYGDFIPGDKFDMGFVAFLSLYGVLLIGYCISEFSAVVTHWSRTKTAFLEVIITIDKFMKENNMHPAIKRRIMAFNELQWQYNSGVELTDDNWLEKTAVPSELRKKVLHQARFKALTSIRFFQVKNKAYIHTLTESARDIILPPQEIVYYGGTASRELYIIESGYCLVTSQQLREAKKERIKGPGNHLGLLTLLYGVPVASTVITLTHCKLISVSYSAYTSALSLFPDMREHEGLLTAEELQRIVALAKSQDAGAYLKHYNDMTKKSGVRITNFFQEFLDDSFINVMKDYESRKESYWKSYHQFHILRDVAPYLLMPIVLKPNGYFLKTWASLRVAAAFLLCLLIPIVVAMAPMCTTFNATIVFLEIICYIDLYLRLHIAYYGSKNQLIYHPYLTAKNYLKRAFAVDFLTCFPWYAMYKLFIPKHDESHSAEDHIHSHHMFHCTLRMINIIQIYKLYAAFWAESIGALKRAYFMSVLQFLFVTIYILNLYSCILIILSCRFVLATGPEDFDKRISRLPLQGPLRETVYHPDGNMICHAGSWIDASSIVKDQLLKPTKVYLLAYYWAATSFSGAGFGDITAQGTSHLVLSIVINVHGVLFFGYVYARIASLKAVADQVVTKFLENLKHLDMFMNREKVPLSLKKSIMEYWKYQWKRTGGWSHQSILGKLHANLNEDAVLYMYEKTLREIPLFENVENSFFRAFAKRLEERYFQKGYMVMRSNEVMDDMFIIYRGKVDIMTDINEVEACMGPGGIFGNIRGAYKFKTLSNIVASRNIDLLCIKGADLYALLKSYPTVYRKVQLSVASAAKDYVLPTIMVDKEEEIQIEPSPLTYETGEDEDETDSMQPTVYTDMDSPNKSVAESHGSKSVNSGYNVHYGNAAWLIFMPHRWFRSCVIPDAKWITFMDYLILFLSYIEFMLLVYEMAFLSNHYFFYNCVLTDIIFVYKLFLDVHTGYMNRYGDYILNPKKVRKMYFSKVYLRRRDFLANLPACYIAFALDIKPAMRDILFVYLRTPQLFRISYIFTYQTHRKINIGAANLFVKLISKLLWASILSHINACLFFKLSCLTPVHCTRNNWMTKEELHLKSKYAEGNYFSLYIASLWYMINLLTITGMGDVSSQNDFEVVETIIVIIIIKFCTGLLISEMSAMITAHSSSLIAYDYSINELRDGLRDMDLSDHQMNKMWDYVRELWNRQQGRQMPELVYKLPYRFRCQLMQAIYGSHIRESIIFCKTHDDFKRMLAMWLRHCVFFPGNYIVQCGDSDQSIYFIHRGEVEVLTVHPNLTESIYDILGPEDSFGIAQGLFVGVPHHFSFRARTVVDIVYLKLDLWKNWIFARSKKSITPFQQR